jgi:hypothetical protein
MLLLLLLAVAVFQGLAEGAGDASDETRVHVRGDVNDPGCFAEVAAGGREHGCGLAVRGDEFADFGLGGGWEGEEPAA